jgi:phage major head subunit gpT-like protein
MTLRERNLKVIEKQLIESEEVKKLRDSLMRRFGVDPVTDTVQFPFAEGKVSLRSLEAKLEEADSASAFTQFLRAGIQQITAGMYKAVDTTWQDWAVAVPSSKDTELYAPNHGVAFPREVGQNEIYPEVGAAALDLELKNKKFGNIYGVTVELANDDQTGTFMQQASLLGEYAALLVEVYAYGKLASVANMKYLDLTIPVSETKPSYESAYPWSTALRGGGATRPSSFGALIQANVQNGMVALMNQKNLQGIKMQVAPGRLVVGSAYRFDAGVLLNSSFYPSGAASAGVVGGAFAVNMLKGILDLTVSRYVFANDGTVDGTSKAWYLMDSTGKPWFIVQQREPVAVVQEAPNSGANFDRDIVRFKASTRFNCDHIDPRFAWQGSDGSV